MGTKTLVEEYSTIFNGIELIVHCKISEEVKEMFNDDYYTYLSENNYNSMKVKKTLEDLLKKANENYSQAKKLYYKGRLSQDELYNYKERIQEIKDEINNLNL